MTSEERLVVSAKKIFITRCIAEISFLSRQ
jgi:hypothetical protein